MLKFWNKRWENENCQKFEVEPQPLKKSSRREIILKEFSGWNPQVYSGNRSASNSACPGSVLTRYKYIIWGEMVAQMVKNLPAKQKIWARSLGWEDPLEKGMATHSNILAWRMPWTEEPGQLQSMGWQRVGHDWATNSGSRSRRICDCITWILLCLEDINKELGSGEMGWLMRAKSWLSTSLLSFDSRDSDCWEYWHPHKLAFAQFRLPSSRSGC